MRQIFVRQFSPQAFFLTQHLSKSLTMHIFFTLTIFTFLFTFSSFTLSNENLEAPVADSSVAQTTSEQVTSESETTSSDLPALSEEQIRLALIDGSYEEKSAALEALSIHYGSASLAILNGIAEAQLFYTEDKKLFNIVSGEDTHAITNILPDFSFGTETIVDSKSDYEKIKINNKIRSQIRQLIAAVKLSDKNPEIRKEAVKDILKKLDIDALVLIKKFQLVESDKKVKELMDVALAIGYITENDEQQLATAIDTLSKSIEPAALNTLKNFVAETEDEKLKRSAESAVQTIEGKHAIFENLETLYFGLSFGSVLVLAGIGLAITFGVMGVINMAHGELIMIGAYTTFVIQQLMPNHIAWSIIVAIPAAFIVSALVGVLMERLVIRHLYGRPLETLLATFGISLILQQGVRSIFSPLNKTVVTPEWMSGMLEINSVFSLTWNRLYIIVFCLIVFFSLLLVMKRSALGLHVRAVSQNRNMARAMGVRSERVDILTFGLGSGIAGIAGVALSLLTNVGPNLGQAYIIDSFIVVVFGGVGNLWGTLVAGMSLGIANKVFEPWAGAVLAKILILVFIVLFIQKRPQGLFPQRGRAAEG